MSLKFILIFLAVCIMMMYSKICEADDCKHTDNSFNCVKYVDNFDGDSVTFDIPDVPAYFGHNAHVRVYGIDTPEMTSKNTCAKKVAIKARNEVRDILSKAKKISLTNIGKEKYGRILANVIADGLDVGTTLVNEKLAYPYFGDTKKKLNWCKY